MQQINDFLHSEPYSLIAHGIFWVSVLVCAPFAAVIMILWTLIRLFLYLSGYSTRTVDTSVQELAVVITGCDSGFGLALAMACHSKGYHVFCGCLNENSLEMFAQETRMTPLVMDVCKDEDVAGMSKAVFDWIEVGGEGSKKRFLHAVVNNAGIGNGGLVDWIGIDVYEKNMEVNCMGQIRVVKAFLPFLKDQYASPILSYQDARIVNMTSMAGLVYAMGMTPYTASKFAAEGFSNALRLELRDFGIKVITMNPSFHETPLTMDMIGEAQRSYDNLPPDLKARYGQEYLEKNILHLLQLPKSVVWRSDNVERDLCRAVDLVHPATRYVTGADARFGLLLQRILPDVIQELTIPRYLHPPAFFRPKEKQT
jgi:NAD(P)-dependent dehydrogenase (short-subunit alcohol dehydrogenase family)